MPTGSRKTAWRSARTRKGNRRPRSPRKAKETSESSRTRPI